MAEPLARIDSGIDGLEIKDKIENIEAKDRVDSGIADMETDDKVADLKTKDKAEDLGTSPPKEKTSAAARRKSSMVPGVHSIKELKESKTPIVVSKETQGTGWKINTSPTTVEEKEILTKFLVTPPVRAIDLHMSEPRPGDTSKVIVLTARNREGVTIKDALTAIHKHYKKKDDDELEGELYLEGFEWAPARPHLQDEDGEKEKEEKWDRLYVWLAANSTAKFTAGGKKKNKKAE